MRCSKLPVPWQWVHRSTRRTAGRALVRTVPPDWLITHGSRSVRQLCLTFDDGPHAVTTPRILDTLAEQQVRATFFVIGERARQLPHLIRRIVDDGHVLGNHSYYHGKPAHTTACQLIRELDRTAWLLGRLGVSTALFRPPAGALSVAKLWRLWQRRQTVVLWSHDPRDYRLPSATAVQDSFLRKSPRGGDIVLLHDAQPQTAAALPELLTLLRQRGFSFRTIREWL